MLISIKQFFFWCNIGNVSWSIKTVAFSPLFPQIKNMWAAFPPDVAGNVDYKNICYVITHGEEKEE